MNALLYSLVDLKKNKTARRDASYTVLYNTVCSTVNKHNTVSLSPACTCRASAIAITAPAVRTARESPCINHVQTLVVSVECTVVPSVCVQRAPTVYSRLLQRQDLNEHPPIHPPPRAGPHPLYRAGPDLLYIVCAVASRNCPLPIAPCARLLTACVRLRSHVTNSVQNVTQHRRPPVPAP